VSRRLLVLTIPVAALGLLFAVALAKEILVSRPLPAPPSLRASQTSLTSGGTPVPDDSPVAELTGYGMIASRSLFSPGRSETSTAASAQPAGRPVLHGVVLDGPKSRAYLEDPLVKGVFGYTLGKPVGPGQIKTISADRVLITGPEGTFEVLLNDPSKPKPSVAGVVPAPAAPRSHAVPVSPTPAVRRSPAVPAPSQQPAAPMSSSAGDQSSDDDG
jgi:hypothetical protein